jgi:hypothetical protein
MDQPGQSEALSSELRLGNHIPDATMARGASAASAAMGLDFRNRFQSMQLNAGRDLRFPHLQAPADQSITALGDVNGHQQLPRIALETQSQQENCTAAGLCLSRKTFRFRCRPAGLAVGESAWP